MFYIKNMIRLLALTVMLYSCGQKGDYKAERDNVMKFHDVVMEDHAVLIANQMKLDSLLKNLPAVHKKYPALDTSKEKVVITIALESLKNAERQMNNWMQQFEPDVTGKSEEDAVAYFKAERRKIEIIDSLYKGQIKASNLYLAQFNK
jgi:hypothetical protein